MIKGIFFDMGGTLVTNENLSFDRVFNCLKRYIPDLTEDVFKENVIDKLNAREDNEIAFQTLLIPLLNIYHVPNADIREIEKVCNRELCDYNLVDGVVEYLKYLKKSNLKLMVLSNTCFSKGAIIDILDRFDLTKYFDDVLVSSEYNYRKPSSLFFSLALKKMNLNPDEILMIGDSFECDVLGARNVQIRSLYLERDEKHYEKETEYLVKIFHSYKDLKEYYLIDELVLDKVISKEALKVVNILKDDGYDAYIVGGSIRNALMGRPIHDYDITTSAYPDDVKRIFEKNDYHVVLTGEKHGTVTVIRNDIPYEVTTFRSDGEYKDSRHPENVKFGVSLAEDLLRRDFTINAMCYDGVKLIDLFDGRKDIARKIIRAVGDPYKRFEEDALRILRGLRFACSLGFTIEKKTKEALLDKYLLLKKISIERINEEILKMANYPCLSIIKGYKKIFEYVYDYKIKNPFLDRIDNNTLTNNMRFAIFGPKLEFKWSSYKMSGKFATEVKIYQNLTKDVNYTLYTFRLDMSVYGRSQMLNNITYLSAVFDWDRDKIKDMKEYYMKSLNMPLNINELNIDGNEIKHFGISINKIKKCKEDILGYILFDELENNNEDIKDYISKHLEDYL